MIDVDEDLFKLLRRLVLCLGEEHATNDYFCVQ